MDSLQPKNSAIYVVPESKSVKPDIERSMMASLHKTCALFDLRYSLIVSNVKGELSFHGDTGLMAVSRDLIPINHLHSGSNDDDEAGKSLMHCNTPIPETDCDKGLSSTPSNEKADAFKQIGEISPQWVETG